MKIRITQTKNFKRLAVRVLATLPDKAIDFESMRRDVARRERAISLGIDRPLATWSDDWLTYSFARNGSYELTQKIFMKTQIFPHLTASGVAVDVGANVGTYSDLFSRYFSRVIAFEPASDLCELMEVSQRYQRVDNIDIRRVALGAAPFEGALERPLQEIANRGMGRIVAEDDGRLNSGHDATVSVRVGDSELGSETDIQFVKIDVEGGEPEVIAGMSKTLHTQQPVVAAEVLEHDALSRVIGLLPPSYRAMVLTRERGARRLLEVGSGTPLRNANLVYFLRESLASKLLGTSVDELG